MTLPLPPLSVDHAGWHVWQSPNGETVANGPDEWNRHLRWPSPRMAVDHLAAISRPLAFAVYCAARDMLERRAADACAALRAIPGVGSGPMGLTPDEVKFAAPYRDASRAYDAAARDLKALHGPNLKRFAKELKAERAARREALLASRAA